MPGTGIRLSGLAKTYATPTGPVPAVRGIDSRFAAGRDRGAARAERRRQVDDDRHAARAVKPDAGTRLDLRRAPADAIAAGQGRSDAAGGRGAARPDRARADRDDGVALSRPDGDRPRARPRRDSRARDRRTREALGRPDAACAVRGRARQRPGPARARRADGRHGRRRPPRLLDDGPRVRRAAARPSSSRRITSKRPTCTPTARSSWRADA